MFQWIRRDHGGGGYRVQHHGRCAGGPVLWPLYAGHISSFDSAADPPVISEDSDFAEIKTAYPPRENTVQSRCATYFSEIRMRWGFAAESSFLCPLVLLLSRASTLSLVTGIPRQLIATSQLRSASF